MTHRPSRGLTLVETLIVAALGASMLVMLAFLMLQFNNSLSSEQTASKASGAASAVMRDMESLIVPADAVLQTHSFASGSYTSTTTSLVLEMPSIDSSGNVIASTYDYAAFYTTGANVYRVLEVNAASNRTSGTKLLSSNMLSLTFSYDTADVTKASLITIDLQIQAQVKQTILSDHRREQVRLRNR